MKQAGVLIFGTALTVLPTTLYANEGGESGPIDRAKYEQHLGERFAKQDTNGDGFIAADEARHPRMIAKFDGDGDGRVSADEYRRGALARFDMADANKDGVLTPEEKQAAFKAHETAKPKE